MTRMTQMGRISQTLTFEDASRPGLLSHLEMVDDRRHSFGFLRKLHSTFPLSLRIDSPLM